MKQTRAAGQEREHAQPRRAQARSRGPGVPPAGRPSRSRRAARTSSPSPSAARTMSPAAATIGRRSGRFSTWLSSQRAWPRSDWRNVVPGTTSGNAFASKLPPPQRALFAGEVGQGLDQEPAQPGKLQDRQNQDEPAGPGGPAEPQRAMRRALALGGHRRRGHNVGPMVQGANSSSPTPSCSLLVSFPLATSRISSKRRRPTLSTGSPSRIDPAFMSMSSLIRSYIGVLVASLMHGVGFKPSTLPRPVVKTSTLAPEATSPVVQGGS